jgi:hypothetical protein
MVGVVGVNWLSQPTAFEKRYENINVLNVKVNIGYFAPCKIIQKELILWQ